MAFLPPTLADPLPDELDVVLLEKDEMARLHGEFCGDPSPTDVITFHHGEILICPVVAEEQGGDWEKSLEDEVLLYGIHGMLHLLGFDDHTDEEYDRMATEQERILQLVLKEVPA